MEHVVFLERDSLDAQVRRPALAHSWEEHGKLAAEEIVPRLQRATIAIVNKIPLRADAIGRLPALKLIAVAATGTDNIDLAACRQRGIVVSNIRDYAVHTVPEHAFALILALRRNLIAYRDDVARGLWQKSDKFCLSSHPIRDLHGATLGIFGEGSLGQGVASLGRAFAVGNRHGVEKNRWFVLVLSVGIDFAAVGGGKAAYAGANQAADCAVGQQRRLQGRHLPSVHAIATSRSAVVAGRRPPG